MTDEEYLRACGWADRWTQGLVRNEDRWTHERREGFTFTIADAVEAQLAEDRARMQFVLDRSMLRVVETVDGLRADIEPKATR